MTGQGAGPTIRLFVDLSDGINRTYDVSRYSIDHGVLRLYAPGPHAAPETAATDQTGAAPEIELAAFAVGGWLRFERDLTRATE